MASSGVVRGLDMRSIGYVGCSGSCQTVVYIVYRRDRGEMANTMLQSGVVSCRGRDWPKEWVDGRWDGGDQFVGSMGRLHMGDMAVVRIQYMRCPA
jgi:hypothetical protein